MRAGNTVPVRLQTVNNAMASKYKKRNQKTRTDSLHDLHELSLEGHDTKKNTAVQTSKSNKTKLTPHYLFLITSKKGREWIGHTVTKTNG